jgi:outer membrane protein assembly factor BamB/tetratricopeptide (TPR) repeat protein
VLQATAGALATGAVSGRGAAQASGKTVYVGSNDSKLYAVDAGTGEQEWTFETSESVFSSPTVVDSTLYVGSEGNSLHAVDAGTGIEQWAFGTSDLVRSSPTVVDGVVYVGSFDNKLYAVDAGTGEQEWAFETNDTVFSSPTVVDDTLYVGGSLNNKLYAVDAATGSQQWAFDTGGSVDSSPTVVGGTVYVGSFDNKLYAVDAATGSQRWAFDTGGSILSSPTVMGGTVYVGSYDSELYAVDAATGSQQWVFNTGNGVDSSPTVVDGTVYVGSYDSKLYAVDAATGNQQWAFETGPVVYSSPTVVDGTVYVGSRDNNLYAVDAATGNQQWAFETGDDVESSPTVVNDPESGGSIGSRVMLGTLGYHGDWRYATAEFSVSVRETTAPVAGESLSVTVEVTASNGDQTTQTVSLSVPNLGSDSQQVTLSGGDTTTVTLSVPTSSGDAGEYTITVASPDDEATATATVDAQPTSGGTDGSGGGDNDGMGTPAMLAVGGGGGGLALLAAYYGLARRSDDDGETDTDDSDGPTDTPAAGPSPGEAPSGAETPATERVDDHLDTAKRRLNRARDPYESGDYDSALAHCERAIDAAKQARKLARDDAPDRVSDTETAIEDVTQLREQIETERDARQEAVSRLDDIETTLDEVQTALDDGNHDAALDSLDSSSEILGTVHETLDEFGFAGLGDRAETLEQRQKSLHERARAQRDAHERATDGLTLAETALDSAEDALDSGDAREALEILDGVPATLAETDDPLEAHDFADLAQRRDVLEQRHKRLQQEAEDALTNVPAEIPTTARRDLTYDDIEKGDLIGSGGNADVYLATVATDDELELALKEPRMSGTLHTETAERMMDEAETWQRLDGHDHIVSVVDYDAEPLPWIGMEYMDAGHLGERADEMPVEQKLWTALTVTKAVRHAHKRGVAHRDLKPENILFRRVEDAWDVPKVADWGLSKHLLEHSKSRDGLTVEYAAPEQFSDSASTDDLTDVYQLGAVFYELFTGRPPFEGEMFAVMKQIETEKPTPPSDIADVPDGLDDVLLTAMAKDRDDRYDDIVYLRDDLQELLSSK